MFRYFFTPMNRHKEQHPPKSLFYYGSRELFDEYIFDIMELSKDDSSIKISPGYLPNYKKQDLKDFDYPAVTYDKDYFVKGLIIQGLSENVLRYLDFFEGFFFERTKALVQIEKPTSLSEYINKQQLNSPEPSKCAITSNSQISNENINNNDNTSPYNETPKSYPSTPSSEKESFLFSQSPSGLSNSSDQTSNNTRSIMQSCPTMETQDQYMSSKLDTSKLIETELFVWVGSPDKLISEDP